MLPRSLNTSKERNSQLKQSSDHLFSLGEYSAGKPSKQPHRLLSHHSAGYRSPVAQQLSVISCCCDAKQESKLPNGRNGKWSAANRAGKNPQVASFLEIQRTLCFFSFQLSLQFFHHYCSLCGSSSSSQQDHSARFLGCGMRLRSMPGG